MLRQWGCSARKLKPSGSGSSSSSASSRLAILLTGRDFIFFFLSNNITVLCFTFQVPPVMYSLNSLPLTFCISPAPFVAVLVLFRVRPLFRNLPLQLFLLFLLAVLLELLKPLHLSFPQSVCFLLQDMIFFVH